MAAGHTLSDDVLSTKHTVDAASYEDRMKWKGFCEIESEPAIFNSMLTSFGVEGVKVQEIISLDMEILACVARPVYGLIFLFKWTEGNPEGKQEQICPEEVWFANQTSNFSCASVALLNIINNIPSIELGDPLTNFKIFTKDFTPALRGDAINNFEFVKGVHNSFARKLDMLNVDLLLKGDALKKRKGTEEEDGDCEAGFHFVAFIPIKDRLWKLDGLERQPSCLGSVDADWLDAVKPEIQARMAQSEESQIEFAIMALVKDPLLTHVTALAENIRSINMMDQSLVGLKLHDHMDADSGHPPSHTKLLEAGIDLDHEQCLRRPNPAFGVTQAHIDRAIVPEMPDMLLANVSIDVAISRYAKLVKEQPALRMAVQEEMQNRALEQRIAAARIRDFGALVQKFALKVKTTEAAQTEGI